MTARPKLAPLPPAPQREAVRTISVEDLARQLASSDPDGKGWHRSLTLQGLGLSLVVAPWVAAHGPVILSLVVDPASAADVTAGVAHVLTDLGGLMALIGRVRLGGLK